MSDSGGSGAFVLILVLAVIGFAIVIVFGIVASRIDKERKADLRAWALKHDYSFSDQDAAVRARLLGWPFETGDDRSSDNVIRGRVSSGAFTALDYSYKTHSSSASADGTTSSSTTTHRHQVLLLDVPPTWPDFSVTPRTLGSRIAATFGGQDVAIGHREFDRRFRVQAGDEFRAQPGDESAVQRILLSMAPALLRWPDESLRVDAAVLLARRSDPLYADDLERWFADLVAAITSASAGPTEQDRPG
jgi:hypothetical protein